MGKGDGRTRRGKIFKGSYGNSRPRKVKSVKKLKKLRKFKESGRIVPCKSKCANL